MDNAVKDNSLAKTIFSNKVSQMNSVILTTMNVIIITVTIYTVSQSSVCQDCNKQSVTQYIFTVGGFMGPTGFKPPPQYLGPKSRDIIDGHPVNGRNYAQMTLNFGCRTF